MSNTTSPADLLRRYLAAIPERERLAPMLHDDVEFTLYAGAPSTATPKGRILRGLEKEFETFYRRESFDLDIIDVFGDDDQACARYTITADTHLGPYRNHYVVVARFEDDLLVEGWEHVDGLAAQRQLSRGDASSPES